MDHLLLGAGGHARSVADMLGRVGTGRIETTTPETEALAVADAVRRGWSVVPAIGDNRARLNALANALTAGADATPVVARSSTTAPDSELGSGTTVLEHAHVGPRARLGQGVIVNTSAVVEHDCVIDDGAHIAPGAVLLGGARVGARTLIGSGARVLPLVSVGADCVIGAGAVVTADLPDRVTAVGCPARVVATAGPQPG